MIEVQNILFKIWVNWNPTNTIIMKKRVSTAMTPMMGLVMVLLLNDLMAGEPLRRTLRGARQAATPTNQSSVTPAIAGGAERLSADSRRPNRGRPQDGDDPLIYDVWKIRGPKRFRDKLIEDLQVFRKETPLFYAMAQKKVKEFIFFKSGSLSCSPKSGASRGTIRLASNDFETSNGQHRKDRFFLTVIRQIQHCAGGRDGSEAAAYYAMYYYGSQTKGVRPDKDLLNNYKEKALGKGYTDTEWRENIRRTSEFLGWGGRETPRRPLR